MILSELPERRTTYRLTRGDFLRPDREFGPLEPDVLAVLPPLPAQDSERPRNRLDLARWLVRGDNPLTPRVTVNRIWMHYFGRGLVETENDFGAQGSPPSHPELLDWLARQFIDSGWSQKAVHRLIVTSATYRQSSQARPDLDTLDPLNRQLARQNRLRLDAEIVRDAALSAAGRLHPKIGGPSVHPPQPEGVYAFTQNRKSWPTDTGANRYRRTLYTMFYRSAPYPLLTTFDSPDFQTTCTRRVRSNTPLQALTMGNDPAMIELAEALAAQVLDQSAQQTPDERIDLAFHLALARPPQQQERVAIREFVRQAAAATSDESASDERAIWTAVARAIMNTDEFVTRE
jgi:hypothetical protein